MNRWFRSVAGIFATILAFFFASLAIGTLDGSSNHPATTLGQLALGAALAFGATVLAGYLAAGLAGWRETVHGGIAGALLGFGAGSSHFQFEGIPLVLTQLVSLVALTPAGLLGGRLRELVMARRRAKNPERPLTLPAVVAPIPALVILGAILSLVLVAVGVLVVAKCWSPRVGWQAILLFAPAGLFLLYRFVFPRPHLTIDEEGIFDHRLDVRFPWSEIQGARFRPFLFFDFVLFRIAQPKRFLERVPAWKRRMMTNEGLFSTTPFGLTMTGTGIRPEALCDLINTEAARRNGTAASA